MNRYGQQHHRRAHHDDDSNIVGEILEDIECLDLDESELENTDVLNADTFGNFDDYKWDPSETFREAELLSNKANFRPRRANDNLKRFSDFDITLRKSPERRNLNRRDQRRSDADKKRNNNSAPQQLVEEDVDECRADQWDKDLESYKRLGLFEITNDYIDSLTGKKSRISNRFKLSQRTLERHIRGVERNSSTIENEYFMNNQEFDRILRIHLAQVCKDPKLQSYSGKWNLYHLGIKNPEEEARSDGDEEEATVEDGYEKKPLNKPNRFGKTSSASIRHGRRLIYLDGDAMNMAASGTVDRNKQIRDTIECCYETLFVLCDVEREIEKCPMNHVAALDKMQRDRNDYLSELYSPLNDDELFSGILSLDKGRLLVTKIGRKLNIEMKLLLLCHIVESLEKFVEICREVDVALEHETSLKEFISLATNAHDLKSLVAFEGSSVEDVTSDTEGYRIQRLLYEHSSFTKLFLFIIEGITLTGHLFLLTSKEGRHTALQRCCGILIKAQQKSKGFEQVLNTRSGVAFINIFLERIHENKGIVDQNIVDMILHYTLEVSEHIDSNQNEWNTLASNIVKML